MLKGQNLQPRILYPARLSFRIEEEIKNYSEKQKLQEFINNKPVLQELLMGLFTKWKEKATTRNKKL